MIVDIQFKENKLDIQGRLISNRVSRKYHMYHRIGHIEFLIHTFITKFHSLNLFGIAINIDELFDCNYVSLSLLFSFKYQLSIISYRSYFVKQPMRITPNHKFKWREKVLQVMKSVIPQPPHSNVTSVALKY